MDISVIVPLFNEAESLPELAAWIERVMDANNFSYEVWFVDDGSTDSSWEVVRELSRANPRLKGVSFRRNYGKSPALNTGFGMAQGDVVITMDADLQDSPDEIPELYRMITEDGYDLVSGWKQKRYDPLSKTIPTKLFNATARKVSGIHNLHDFNCGLKAYRREVVKHIEVYGDMHRYIPYLAKNAGFGRIGEKVVHHQARKYGKTKFGLDRFVNGYLDLATLWFTGRFGAKPMHFFRAARLADVYCRIHRGGGCRYRQALQYDPRTALHARYRQPLFLSVADNDAARHTAFPRGFVGELVVRNSPRRNSYEIRETLDPEA